MKGTSDQEVIFVKRHGRKTRDMVFWFYLKTQFFKWKRFFVILSIHSKKLKNKFEVKIFSTSNIENFSSKRN
jgi:hypothetical protein